MARVYEIHPLEDKRWQEFLERHAAATVFHSPGWLWALRRTYGYMPSALTTNGPGEHLTDALVFCHVRSWMTGHRLVSVPFADHCEPLVDSKENCASILLHLKSRCHCEHGRYIEIRAGAQNFAKEFEMSEAASFCLHTIDLRPPLCELFDALHHNSIQRKIARADREGVA